MTDGGRRRAWRISSAALVLAGALATGVARAEQGTLLLLIEPDAGALGARVRAELASLGFTVQVKPLPQAGADAPTPPASYLEEARGAGAAAVVRVKPGPSAAEIWVIDRVTGKAVRREVPTPAPRDDALLATKTVELLRASLLEIDVPGFQPAEVPPPPAARRLPPAPAPARGAVLVGAGPAFGGTVGTMGTLWIGAQHRAWRFLWTGLRLGLPVGRPTRDGPEGTATVALSGAFAALEAAPWHDHRLSPALGLVVGGLWLRAVGSAQAPYVSRTADVFSFAAGARAAVSLLVVGPVRLRLDGGITALAPRPKLLFADRVTGAMTQPLPDVAGAIEIDAW